MDARVRQARPDDADDVVAFTQDTWADRDADDYLPDVFEEWVESDNETQRTFVATADGTVVGVLQMRLLSADEAWCQGMRVHPDYRGRGISRVLTYEGWDWAADRGAAVARNMVFGWNERALAAAQGVGFEPTCAFRWAHPEPNPANGAIYRDPHGPGAAWQYWQGSRTRSALSGLAIDPEETWALSLLRREILGTAADDGRLLTVGQDRIDGFAVRNRTFEREDEPWVEYSVAAWRDRPAARELIELIQADAASLDVTQTRIPVPETAIGLSHAAATGARLAETADIVFTADLSTDYRTR